MTLTELQHCIRDFCRERDWGDHHTPKNLALAIAGEAGELAHIYRWQETADQQMAADEVADVVIFALRFFDVLGVDPEDAILDKIRRNGEKYPAP